MEDVGACVEFGGGFVEVVGDALALGGDGEQFGADLGLWHGVGHGQFQEPVFLGVEIFEGALEGLAHGAGGGLFVGEGVVEQGAGFGDECGGQLQSVVVVGDGGLDGFDA
ncbi:hypothetical protein ACWDSJ_14180 [Nocardia sp. NPDC003482]